MAAQLFKNELNPNLIKEPLMSGVIKIENIYCVMHL
jgi:hypothetical protein